MLADEAILASRLLVRLILEADAIAYRRPAASSR